MTNSLRVRMLWHTPFGSSSARCFCSANLLLPSFVSSRGVDNCECVNHVYNTEHEVGEGDDLYAKKEHRILQKPTGYQ